MIEIELWVNSQYSFKTPVYCNSIRFNASKFENPSYNIEIHQRPSSNHASEMRLSKEAIRLSGYHRRLISEENIRLSEEAMRGGYERRLWEEAMRGGYRAARRQLSSIKHKQSSHLNLAPAQSLIRGGYYTDNTIDHGDVNYKSTNTSHNWQAMQVFN